MISGATFSAGNVLLLSLAIVWLAGEKAGLLLPYIIYGTLVGLVFSGLVDIILAYKIFDSPFYPATNPWPIGVSTALSIRAGLERGKKALLPLYGAIVGTILTYFKYPGDVMGIALIGNVWAITMFGIGLILRAYSPQWFGIDLYKMYAPHGIMIGARIAAILQFVILYIRVRGRSSTTSSTSSVVGTLVSAGEALRSIVMALALWLVGACSCFWSRPPQYDGGWTHHCMDNILWCGSSLDNTCMCPFRNARWLVPSICHSPSHTYDRVATGLSANSPSYRSCVCSCYRPWYGRSLI